MNNLLIITKEKSLTGMCSSLYPSCFSYVVKDTASLSSELYQEQVSSGHVSSVLSLTLHCPTFSSANKCLLKVAAYAAQLEQYQKAIEIYEQVSSLLSP